MGYESVQMNAAVLYFRESSDGNLATAPSLLSNAARSGGSAGGSVIEKCSKARSRCRRADFNSQSALSRQESSHPQR